MKTANLKGSLLVEDEQIIIQDLDRDYYSLISWLNDYSKALGQNHLTVKWRLAEDEYKLEERDFRSIVLSSTNDQDNEKFGGYVAGTNKRIYDFLYSLAVLYRNEEDICLEFEIDLDIPDLQDYNPFSNPVAKAPVEKSTFTLQDTSEKRPD